MKRKRIQYAKDEIITDLYTVGSEYMYHDTYEEYVGPYHMYTTGEVFTEFDWNPNRSRKLIKYQNNDTPQFIYKTLTPTLKTTYESIPTHVAQPTDEDLKNGYFQRYFITKFNETIISEINQDTYNKYLANDYDINAYKATEIKWYISGVQYTTLKRGIQEIGVYEKNKNSVLNAESVIPGMSNKLTNYLEYYIGDLTDIVVPKDING